MGCFGHFLGCCLVAQFVEALESPRAVVKSCCVEPIWASDGPFNAWPMSCCSREIGLLTMGCCWCACIHGSRLHGASRNAGPFLQLGWFVELNGQGDLAHQIVSF